MFIYGCTGLSLVGTSRGYSLVAVHGLLIVVASFVVEHGLSCSVACGIFLDQDQTHVPCTGGELAQQSPAVLLCSHYDFPIKFKISI